MPKEYPEHIDQLDDFYQQHLVDLEILPPADMWDRISAAYTQGSIDKDKAVGFFTNKKKIIGVVAVALFLSTSTYLYVSNCNKPNDEENTLPVIKNELQADSSSVDIKERESKKSTNIKEHPSAPVNGKISGGDRKTKANNDSELDYTSTNVDLPNNMVVNEPEIIIQKEEPKLAEEEKTPKKKTSFKDKYKKDYQDSTHKLFVPSK